MCHRIYDQPGEQHPNSGSGRKNEEEIIKLRVEELLSRFPNIQEFANWFETIDLQKLTKDKFEHEQNDINQKMGDEIRELKALEIKNITGLTADEVDDMEEIGEEIKILGRKSRIIQGCIAEIEGFLNALNGIS